MLFKQNIFYLLKIWGGGGGGPGPDGHDATVCGVKLRDLAIARITLSPATNTFPLNMQRRPTVRLSVIQVVKYKHRRSDETSTHGHASYSRNCRHVEFRFRFGRLDSQQTCRWAGHITAGGPSPALLNEYKSCMAHWSARRQHRHHRGILPIGDRHRSRQATPWAA